MLNNKPNYDKVVAMFEKLGDEEKAKFTELLTKPVEEKPIEETPSAETVEEVTAEQPTETVETMETVEETPATETVEEILVADPVKELSEKYEKLEEMFKGLVAKVEGAIDSNAEQAKLIEFGLAEKSREHNAAEPPLSARAKWDKMLRGEI